MTSPTGALSRFLFAILLVVTLAAVFYLDLGRYDNCCEPRRGAFF